MERSIRLLNIGLFLSIALIVSGLYSVKPSLLERFSLKVEDLKLILRNELGFAPEPSRSVVVVAIDEKSVNELGRWPWSRRVMAKLVDNLRSAKVVAFDVVFSERESPDSDSVFAKSIQKHGSVILGYFFRNESTQHPEREALEVLLEGDFPNVEVLNESVGIWEASAVELPISDFAVACAGLGFLNVFADEDALYRHYPLLVLYRGTFQLPLALQMLRLYTYEDPHFLVSQKGVEKFTFKGESVPLYGSTFKVNFYRTRDIKVISAVDVVRGNVDEELIKDKAILIGATEIGIFDLRPTPVDHFLPGVFIHATVFSNLLEGHFLRTYPWADFIAVWVVTLVAWKVSGIRSTFLRIGGFVIVAFSFFLLSFALFILGLDLNVFYPTGALVLGMIAGEVFRVSVAERNVRELRRAFKSYVSPQVLEVIVKNPESLKLGGEKKVITVLFSDIRDFTTISENMDPQKLVKFLNSYLSPMTDIVLKKGGMLDKYIGDAIMAVFNAPLDLPDHADRACECALEMVKTLGEISPRLRREFGQDIRIGIGINTGEAVVGNMGSHRRFDYTAVGDTVNLASRLEGLNKVYNTSILVSEFTKNSLKKEFLLRKVDKVIVKGKTKPIEIYELMEDTPENRSKKEIFERALDLYMEGRFEEAYQVFLECMNEFDDKVCEVFLRRCRQLEKEKPANWRGVFVAKEK